MARSGYKDYWTILQVPKGADQATIKQAFRRLARQNHPDVNPDDEAAEARFKEINEAYEVLSDPEKRRRYEQFGRFWSGDRRQTSGGAGVDMDFQNYGNFDEFINDLLSRFGEGSSPGGFSASGFPRPGRPRSRPLDLDAETSLEISFAEAFHGCERTLAVRTFGKNQESVQVRIPAGILPATRLRLKGKGNLQPGTGRRGDLYLKIQLKPHPVWRLEKDQLKADLALGLDEAVLGGEIEVPTPQGHSHSHCSGRHSARSKPPAAKAGMAVFRRLEGSSVYGCHPCAPIPVPPGVGPVAAMGGLPNRLSPGGHDPASRAP